MIGVHTIERREAKRKGYRRSKTVNTPKVSLGPIKNADHDGGASEARGAIQSGGPNPITNETWDQMGFETHITMARYDPEKDQVVPFVHSSEDAAMCKRIYEKSPGRGRGRPRRPKNGDSK